MNYRKKISNSYVKAIETYLKYIDRSFVNLTIIFPKLKKRISVLPEIATRHLFKITMVIFVIVFLIFFVS